MIAKEDLKASLDEILLIDVRKESDWNGSERKILRAIREDPNEVAIWAARFPMDRPVIVYCACPRGETSSRVALQLRELGFTDVSALKGGWREWAAAEYPTVIKDEPADEARPHAS
jgi:rhodanese-related sulfurtransferase